MRTLKVFVQEANSEKVVVSRIDDPYFTLINYSAKSFIVPEIMTELKPGFYEFRCGDKHKVADAYELDAADIAVKKFCQQVSKLSMLNNGNGFVLDMLRKEADKLALIKSRQDPSNPFWKRKREYWPWFYMKKLKETTE